MDDLRVKYKDSLLRPWQKDAVKQLDAQSNREVLWIVDSEGNKGKTYLSRYLVARGDCFLVRNGGTKDIAYSYNYEKIIVFDFVRSTEDFINYGVIENFKDGFIFSPKYQSTVKYFENAKVICFSNFEPDKDLLSEDRWNIIYL